MAIQWFPGHMHATRKALVQRLKDTDVVIEMLDARLPGSSANPLLRELLQPLAQLKLLNKSDLADPERTQLWLQHYQGLGDTQALAIDASAPVSAQKIMALCRALAPQRGGMHKPLRVVICGVPNVGKSTLVNRLAGRKASATGDEAGITRREQRIVLDDDFYLFDTPGLLWPRIAVPQSGCRLAASGAIGRNAYGDEEVALDLLDYLKRQYPQRLEQRYGLAAVAELPDEALLEAIGRKRAALQSQQRVNLQKAAEIVIQDLRSAQLGRVTLETPAEFAQWLALAQAQDLAREQRKAQRRARATGRAA